MIIVDTREKARAIELILKTFEEANEPYVRQKLDVGDYQNTNRPWIVVDRKQNLLEVANNIGQDRIRFLNEIRRAEASGIHIVFPVSDCIRKCLRLRTAMTSNGAFVRKKRQEARS